MTRVQFNQPVWSQWAIAAVEQRDMALAARADLAEAWGGDGWVQPAQRELRHSMLSVVASAAAIEGWAFASMGTARSTTKTLGAGGVIGVVKARLVMARADRKRIEAACKELFGELRNELVHHKAPVRDGGPHPVLGNTPYESARYRCETAASACELLRTLVTVTLVSPSPENPPAPDAVGHAAIVVRSVGWD